MVPSADAIFASMPWTLIEALATALVSPVSMATICAPAESPTNRIPLGPKARGPADLTSAFPVFIPVVAGAATARAHRETPASSVNRVERFIKRAS